LLERSRCLNIPLVIEYIKEFNPENLFLERFNEVKFEEIIGRGPSNLFELKSSSLRLLNLLVDIFGNLPLIWLDDKFKYCNVKGASQNQVGMIFEILLLETSSKKRFL
jgi:hypothetical protein